VVDLVLVCAEDLEGMASVKVNCGPPLSPTYSCPSKLKLTVMTLPSGAGIPGP